jgi:hypothetical protein
MRSSCSTLAQRVVAARAFGGIRALGRQEDRRRFTANTRSVVRLRSSGLAAVVRLRDLSSVAIGFEHTEPIGVRCECRVRLETLDHAFLLVDGKVIRCEPAPLGVFNLAVRFHQPLDVGRFAPRPHAKARRWWFARTCTRLNAAGG